MNDTPDVIAEIMRKKFMQKKRKMIFLRFYGNEFDHPTIKKVLTHLDNLSV